MLILSFGGTHDNLSHGGRGHKRASWDLDQASAHLLTVFAADPALGEKPLVAHLEGGDAEGHGDIEGFDALDHRQSDRRIAVLA